MEREEVDRSLISGVAWTGSAQTAVQVVRWAATLLVARLLDPTAFGIVGMALVLTRLIEQVSEFGLGAAIVQGQGRLAADQIAQLGGIAVLTGLGQAAVLAVLAPLVAAFFREPAVTMVVVVLSFQFVIHGFRVVPLSLLSRDLRFKPLAWIRVCQGLAAAAAACGLALAGAGYWAIVAGLLAESAVGSILCIVVRPHPIRWPRTPSSIADEIRFGLHQVLNRIAGYIYSSADFAVVGRFFGKTSLGDYTIGWNLASIPVERVTNVVSGIALPVLSRLQAQPREFNRALRNITQAVSLATFPVAVGLALVADVFVEVVLGPKWLGAIVPLRILAIAAAFRSIPPILSVALIAAGRPDLASRYSLTAAAALPLAFIFAGVRFGLDGIAWTWLALYPVLVGSFLLRWTCRQADLRIRTYLAALGPATLGTLVMALAVLTARWGVLAGASPLAVLAASVVVGALAYLLLMVTVFRPRLRRLLALLREHRKRSQPEPVRSAS